MIRPHYVPLYSGVSMSEKLAALPDDSCRLFYTWLLSHCDAWGRSKAGAGHLTAKVWPLLGKTREDTERALEECWAAGLIVRYDVDGEAYLAVPDWEEKAGKVGDTKRRGKSLFPAPPDGLSKSSPGIPGVVLPRARAQDPIRSDPSFNRTEIETHPIPPEGRADRFGFILDVIRTVPGNGSATAVHAQTATALREAGFEVDVELPVANRGDGRRGFVDLRVRDPDCWIEIDRCRPREKSIVKLRGTPGRRVIVLRSAEFGDHPCADGIDAVIGLGGKGGRLSQEDIRIAIARQPALDTDGFRLAFSLWIAYREEKEYDAYMPIGLQACLSALAKLGPARAIAAIEHTMAKGWKGIREDDSSRGGAPQGIVPKGRDDYRPDPAAVLERRRRDEARLERHMDPGPRRPGPRSQAPVQD